MSQLLAAMRFLWIALWCCWLVLPAHAFSQEETLPRLTGTFIQYQPWMMSLRPAKWIAELNSMKRAGLQTIVLQWLQADGVSYSKPTSADPTEIILSYADREGLQVYLGLSWESAWWKQWNEERFLRGAAARAVSFAHQLQKRYGKHKSFVGWYIPYELSDSDFEESTQTRLRQFLHTIAEGANETTSYRKSVALSVYFEEKLSPKDIDHVYSRLLPESGVDLLLIQDGVGSRAWSPEEAVPYVEAYARAARQAGMQAWAVAESFESVHDREGQVLSRVPAQGCRLRLQLERDASVTEKVITFDFFHYMSPQRGRAQRKLFLNYLDQLRKSTPVLSSESACRSQQAVLGSPP